MNLHLAKYLDRYFGIFLCYLFAALHLFKEMISPRESVIRVRRILLVKFWGIGNLLLLLPIFRLVRERYPRAEIHLLTLKRNRGLVEDCPDLDRIWSVNDDGALPLVGSLVRTIAGLRRSRIDLFLDFEQFARTSTLIGFLIGAPQRVGLKTPRQGRFVLYTAPVRYREDQHMSETFLDVARSAGVSAEDYRPLPLAYRPEEERRVERLLAGAPGRLVVVHVGSGDNFIGRRWPPESFAVLVDRLVDDFGVRPVFTGTPAEAPLVHDVLSRMARADHALDLSGRLELRELAALIDRAEIVISNDTGPVHLASGSGRRVLGFYGPNTPVLYGPLSPGSRAFYKGLPCSPCITNINYKTSFCRLPVCIRNISVEEVYRAAASTLSEPVPPAEAS
jgi:ADP-heptose:LPS heptosyltransferase